MCMTKKNVNIVMIKVAVLVVQLKEKNVGAIGGCERRITNEICTRKV